MWYRTGTITTNGTAVIIGIGTNWLDAGILNPGDEFKGPDKEDYELLSVDSNLQITLFNNYTGSDGSGQPYAIVPLGLLPAAMAKKLVDTLAITDAALATISTLRVNLVDAANVSVDISTGNIFDVTIAGNRTFNFSGGGPLLDGKKFILRITQGSGGSHTFTPGTGAVFSTDLASITLSTVAGKTDYIACAYRHAATAYDIIAIDHGRA